MKISPSLPTMSQRLSGTNHVIYMFKLIFLIIKLGTNGKKNISNLHKLYKRQQQPKENVLVSWNLWIPGTSVLQLSCGCMIKFVFLLL